MIFLLILPAIATAIIFYKKTVPVLNTLKKNLLITLRSLALFIVLLLLINPILYFNRKITNKPEVLILEDKSLSMQQLNEHKNKSELLKPYYSRIISMLTKNNFQVSSSQFANGLEGSSQSTLLGTTLEEFASKHNLNNLKAIFLFSDGWFKDKSLEVLDEINIPIYTFSPSFNNNLPDLGISQLKFNKTTYKNEATPIITQIYAHNYTGTAKVDLYIENKKISTEKINFQTGESQDLIFEHTFTNTGLTSIKAVISPLDTNEVNSANNHYSDIIQVLNNRSTALIISDNLNWESKFITDAINSNSRWNSIFLLKQNYFKHKNQIVTLNDYLKNTKVIILLKNHELFLSSSEAELIQNFVKNGGGLITQGKYIPELAEILPITSTQINSTFQAPIFFTDNSKQYQSFEIEQNSVKNIPPVDYYYVKPKLNAEILAKLENEEQSPAILFNNIDQGKILYFAFHNFWKWQLWDDTGSYNKLISNLCSWLSQTSSERFVAATDKNSYYTGEEIKIDLKAYDEKLLPLTNLDPKISISNSDGKVISEEYIVNKDGIYTISLKDLDPDKYSYIIRDNKHNLTTEGEFVISTDSPENRDIGFNLPLLSYISHQTGGKLLDNNSIMEFKLPKMEAKTILLKNEFPLYRKWYLIAIFLICFCLELFLRKRWGLL